MERAEQVRRVRSLSGADEIRPQQCHSARSTAEPYPTRDCLDRCVSVHILRAANATWIGRRYRDGSTANRTLMFGSLLATERLFSEWIRGVGTNTETENRAIAVVPVLAEKHWPE
jgi:hypothetical protein